MKLSNIIAIIAIAAVLVFFIITYAFPGAPAWLVFIAAGLGMVIASGLKKDELPKEVKKDLEDAEREIKEDLNEK